LKAHGGALIVVNAPSVGAIVTLQLPLLNERRERPAIRYPKPEPA